MHRFDPLDQCAVDLPEFAILPLQLQATGLQLGHISRDRDGQWRLR